MSNKRMKIFRKNEIKYLKKENIKLLNWKSTCLHPKNLRAC